MSERVLSGTVRIAGGADFVHPLRRLKQAWPNTTWQPVATGNEAELALGLSSDLPEGGFRITPTATGAGIAGGSLSGVIYAVDQLIAESAGKVGLVLPSRIIEDAPKLAYRSFWTWDHSTNWELSQIGLQEIGVFNPYQKPPGGFLEDYKRLVDFCSLNRIAGVVIFGFLRDTHGGIPTAQELCRYGKERGVRIIPGIAIGAYGGVYWEGDHPYNLATWLKKNPQHAATMEKGIGFQLADLAFPLNFPRSDYTMTACPSAPQTMEWMEEAVGWLAETFEIGGINIESGDYGVCGCERCVARRKNAAEAARRRDDHGDSWSHTDMAQNFPRLYQAANARRKDLWVYCEMQWDNLLDPVARQEQQKLPRGGIYQHTANKSFWRRLRTELRRDYVEALPTQPNILRCQFACQWNGDERTERYALNARTFADMAQIGWRDGMEGLTVWGEPSPYTATVELSYLAYARFCWNPELTWDAFVADDVAPLLGGAEAARRFIAIAEEVDAHQRLPVEHLAALRDEAFARMARHPGDAARRWMTLGEQIARREYMGA